MSGTVFSHQAGPIQAKHNGQFKYGYIVNYVVVSSLGKAGINVTVGNHALFGQACRKSDGMPSAMPTSNTLSGNDNSFRSTRNRLAWPGHRYNFFVLFGQFYKGVTKNILKPQWLVFYFVGSLAFAGLLLNLPGA
jgi:hypothetical protein